MKKRFKTNPRDCYQCETVALCLIIGVATSTSKYELNISKNNLTIVKLNNAYYSRYTEDLKWFPI